MTTLITIGDDFETCSFVPLPVFTKARLMSQFSIKTYGRPKAVCTPTSVEVAGNGDYIICDQTDRTIKVFNKMAQLKNDFGTHELQSPWNASLLPCGDIAVTDTGEYPLVFYSQRGDVLHKVPASELGTEEACAMVVDQKGDVVLVDSKNNNIYRYDYRTKSVKERLQVDSTFPLKDCRHLCINRHQNEYVVSDRGDGSIKAYNLYGYLAWRYEVTPLAISVDDVTSTGSSSSCGDSASLDDVIPSSSKLDPQGVCCDQYGHFIFVDGASRSVFLLTERGKLERQLVSAGKGTRTAGDVLLQAPLAVAMDNEGQIIISDTKSAEIKMFNYLQ